MNNATQWIRKQICLLASTGVLLAAGAQAGVTNLVWYHLGERDAGAVAGASPAGTIDSAGTNHLTFSSGAIYSSDVSIDAGAHVASALSVLFTNSAFATNNVVS